MVICLERGADLHVAQLMPLPPTVSCFSKIQIGFTFLVPADLGSPGKRAVRRVCVCAYLCYYYYFAAGMETNNNRPIERKGRFPSNLEKRGTLE